MSTPCSINNDDFFGADESPRLPISASESETVDEEATPLHLAVEKGDQEGVRQLLEQKACINVLNAQERTPLHVAVIGANIEIIDMLLEKKPDLTVRDRDGKTVLHWAAEKKLPNIIKQLLEAKCWENKGDSKLRHFINLTDWDGNTALHEAVGVQCMQSVRLLLDAGIDVCC